MRSKYCSIKRSNVRIAQKDHGRRVGNWKIQTSLLEMHPSGPPLLKCSRQSNSPRIVVDVRSNHGRSQTRLLLARCISPSYAQRSQAWKGDQSLNFHLNNGHCGGGFGGCCVDHLRHRSGFAYQYFHEEGCRISCIMLPRDSYSYQNSWLCE